MENHIISFIDLQKSCGDDLLYLICFEIYMLARDIKLKTSYLNGLILFKKYDIIEILNKYHISISNCKKGIKSIEVLNTWISNHDNLVIENIERQDEKTYILNIFKEFKNKYISE